MSLTAAAAGALAGVVVEVAGFGRLAWSALALSLIIVVANVLIRSRSPVDEEESVAHG